MILSPTGHIESVAGVLEDWQSTWLLADVGAGGRICEFLMSMKFMMDVDARIRPDIVMVGVYGDGRAALSAVALRANGGAPLIWDDPWPVTAAFGATYGPVDVDHPAHDARAHIALVDKAAPGCRRSARCGRASARWRHRVGSSAGWVLAPAPRNRGGRARPAARTGVWIRTAVHLEKGCYRGQETVAKLVNLGKPPRRLTLLYLEGPPDELPQHGDPVLFGEREVGQITSAVRHYEDGPIALALLRRNLDPAGGPNDRQVSGHSGSNRGSGWET